MTALSIIPISTFPIIPLEPCHAPTIQDCLAAFTAAGVRPYVFRGKIGFGLERNHDWDEAYRALELLSRLPGQTEALKRHLENL